MPYNQAVFANGEFYHVYNRGVEKRSIFLTDRDYQRFLHTIDYYRFKNPPSKFSTRNSPSLKQRVKDEAILVEIVCFSLMPNHFHFLLRQVDEGGISKFISKLVNSYTKYFNTRHVRVGPLFQGAFKAKRIEDDEQLLHLSRYIHLNPLVDYLTKDLTRYKFSSYPEFVGLKEGFCQSHPILGQFTGMGEYQRFVLDQEDYGRSIKYLERALVESE
ncbi:MAG: transposase [bacterium]|nr:transposase [bacterium]